MVLTDSAQLSTILFFQGTGDGHFQPSKPFPVSGPTGSLTIGDVDGDGFQDLMIQNGPMIIYGPCP